MNVPSPFQQRQPQTSGVDAKSMLPGGASPISGPGAQPEVAPMTPTPAPVAPVAPPAPKVSPVVPAPAVRGAPAGLNAPAAPAPQMVPAYVAKAMEKQNERLAKENAMVPAPAAGATPAAPAATTAATETPAPTRAPQPEAAAGAAQATTTTEAAPDYSSMKSVEYEHNPDGSIKTNPDGSPVLAVDPYAPAPDDTPEKVDQKKTGAQLQADLRAKFEEYMNATEDPAFKAQYNRLLMQSALENQATIDATKRAIAANPSLAGQPAGDAMLGLKAIQLGMSLDEMKGSLTVENAKAVAAMNKYGLEGLYRLNQDQMAQDDKDLLSYSGVLQRMASSGATRDEMEAYYNKTIVPLLGGKDISFDQFLSPSEIQGLLSGVQTDGLEQFRNHLDQGDLPGALQALEAAYSPAKQIELGNALIAKNDVATINNWLKDAGYDPIETMADLIGREDDVFIAEQVSKGKKKIADGPIQSRIDSILGGLRGTVDITDPDVIDAVRAWVLEHDPAFGGDPESEAKLPWQDDKTSFIYKDWEIFDPTTGRTIDAGGEFYDPKDNPEPAPGSAAYDWRSALDGAWQKYLASTPTADRLSRDDWFAEFKKGYTGSNKDVAEFAATWTPPKKTVEIKDRPEAIAEGERAIKAADAFKNVDWTDPNVKEFVANLDRLEAKDVSKALAAAGSQSVVNIGGKIYRVQGLENVGGGVSNDYIRLEDQQGNVVWIRNGTTAPLTALPTKKAAAPTTTSTTTTNARSR